MTNNCKYVIFCCILLLFTSCSKAPDEDESKKQSKAMKKSALAPNQMNEILITDLILKASDIGEQYTQTTSLYKDRASLKFLKRPVNGVEVIHQDFSLKDDTSRKITVLILKYKDIQQAKKEIELNFNILENLANKENFDSFQINMFGDQSMAIKFPNRSDPFFLYSRYGNIVVKINAGKDSHMDKLIETLKKIEQKLIKKSNN